MEKRLDYEILRIVAIFGVVFNHTWVHGFDLYSVSGPGINFTASLILAILCKVAVPLFFMISGGLLLEKEESLRTLFQKRILRMVLVLLLFSALSYGFKIHWGEVESPGVFDFIYRIWHEDMTIPYWYLYSYLALLLMLPLLRPMVKAMPNQAFVYLLGLHICYYGILTPIGYLFGFDTLSSDLFLPMIERVIFYFLMGYYAVHRFSWKLMTKKHLALLGVAAAAAVLIMYLLTWHDISSHGEITWDFKGTWLWIPTFFIYALIHQLVSWHPPKRAAKLIEALGSCVFGTYLLEGILRVYLVRLCYALEPKIHVLPACFIWVFCVVICGMAITWVLKKIPGLKKLL